MSNPGEKQAVLWALSPLDGRYAKHAAPLSEYFSEAALIFYRIRVECAWLLHLSTLARSAHLPADWQLSESEKNCLGDLMQRRDESIALRVKEIEKTSNHDVKAVEYFLREALGQAQASARTLAFIHFAATSEDINNLAYALMLREANAALILPQMNEVSATLAQMSKLYADLPMLARTHGQSASPTTLGKELAVFGARMQRQVRRLAKQEYLGKMSGAVGNYNAHVFVYPSVDWQDVARDFVENRLGLSWNAWTTQIENHDYIAEYADCLRLYGSIAIDLTRDTWTYISLGYFKQRVQADEVGSSTMPHKVNPIDFENAEGNYGLAAALAGHFATKLPISRLQRDLSDSTVLRSLGSMLGYHSLAQSSLLKGLGKLEVDEASLAGDLASAWELLAEPIQTLWRAYGLVDAYERLKKETRGKRVSRSMIAALLKESGVDLKAADAERLLNLSPASYTGLAGQLARDFARTVLGS